MPHPGCKRGQITSPHQHQFRCAPIRFRKQILKQRNDAVHFLPNLAAIRRPPFASKSLAILPSKVVYFPTSSTPLGTADSSGIGYCRRMSRASTQARAERPPRKPVAMYLARPLEALTDLARIPQEVPCHLPTFCRQRHQRAGCSFSQAAHLRHPQP